MLPLVGLGNELKMNTKCLALAALMLRIAGQCWPFQSNLHLLQVDYLPLVCIENVLKMNTFGPVKCGDNVYC